MLKNKAFIAILAVVLAALSFSSCSEKSVTPVSPHQEAAGIVIMKNGNTIFRVFNGVVDSTVAKTLEIDSVLAYPCNVRFLGENGNILDSVESEVSFVATLDNPEISEVLYSEMGDDKANNNFLLIFKRKKAGLAGLTIRLDHEGHADFTTPKFTIRVK